MYHYVSLLANTDLQTKLCECGRERASYSILSCTYGLKTKSIRKIHPAIAHSKETIPLKMYSPLSNPSEGRILCAGQCTTRGRKTITFSRHSYKAAANERPQT